MAEPPEDDRLDVRGLLGGVGRSVAGRMREQLEAARADPAVHSPRDAAAAVVRGLAEGAGGLVTDARHDVAGLVQQEIGALRGELLGSARAGARGAALLGVAAATGQTALVFTGVAAWRGLGNRIDYARSAVVVAAVAGAATTALATRGVVELSRVPRSRRRTTTERISGADRPQP